MDDEMSENKIMKDIQVAMSIVGARVFRNNVGLFETKDGRKIKTGLCVGSSDLIGFDRKGRFIAIEVKRPGGERRIEQKRFIELVNSFGGIAFFADSQEDALRKYKEATSDKF